MMKRSKLCGVQGRKMTKEDEEHKEKYRGMYNDAIIIVKQI